jgi:hypothetical protein
MLPFIEPLKLPSYQSSTKGIYAMLQECDRHIELTGPPLDLEQLFKDVYSLKRSQAENRATVWNLWND